MARPLCRYCGKPIAKRIRVTWFVDALPTHAIPEWQSYVVGAPTTKEEAQRLVNGTVVSVQKKGYGADADRLRSAGVWDGESYADPFFCNGSHARDFAYATLHSQPTLGCNSYHKALAAQKADT